MGDRDLAPPGIKWILIIGLACFAAGFVGPMVLVPSSNIGPLIGIIYTGPGGVALGAGFWLLCALFRPAARSQWRMLKAIAIIAVIGILLSIHPEPKYRGYVIEGHVEACDRPADLEADTLQYWQLTVAEAQGKQPRADWQTGMRESLRAAPGAVVSVRMARRNPIRQHQKLWDHSAFAAG